MKPKATPGQTVPLKRQLSRWDKEQKRRRFLAVMVAVVIVAAGVVIGVGFYNTKIKPWHQTIARVNDRVFDMNYFVKVLRLYGLGEEDSYYASYMVQIIQANELARQKAEELGIEVTGEEMEEELKNRLGFDPESETEDDFNQRLEDFLKERDISRAELEQMAIEPIILREKVQEAIGDDVYHLYEEKYHVQVKAMFLGTKEKAEDVRDKWDGDFDQLVEDYSPSRYYPDEDSVEWLPLDIESSAFDDYAFDEGSLGSGISQPIRDTAYTTTGGYWLVMVLEKEGEGEEEVFHIQGILLDSKEEAENIAGEFDGENFTDLATEHSLHTASSASGGEMGWLGSDSIESLFGEDNLDDIQALSLNMPSEPIYYEDISKQSGYWVIDVLGESERELSEEHRESLSFKAYSEWLEEAMGNEVESYLDSGKISWAFEHI